ncbi:hypothetical protein L1987_27524 [Smallanthus sonchifolius]|uniref:Uncharacterized protein n=1 Tax=Smallanthus sonchifolius TaxID=185202 RepID=A0ACB9ICU3_9ASTR|nr:hypothetical protein L1987_27524 [Smallanthus sonchifolius]
MLILKTPNSHSLHLKPTICNMAMPLGFFCTCCAAVTPSLAKSPSSSSVMLVQPASLRLSHAKLRTSVIHATASEPATETKKRAPRDFSKPRPVSHEMKEFLGGRTEIHKCNKVTK